MVVFLGEGYALRRGVVCLCPGCPEGGGGGEKVPLAGFVPLAGKTITTLPTITAWTVTGDYGANDNIVNILLKSIKIYCTLILWAAGYQIHFRREGYLNLLPPLNELFKSSTDWS
jgi:hypothetical protein